MSQENNCQCGCEEKTPIIKLPVESITFSFDASELKDWCCKCAEGPEEPGEPEEPEQPEEPEEGVFELTTLGGDRQYSDWFQKLVEVKDGFVACGTRAYSSSEEGLVAHYSKDLAFQKQVLIQKSSVRLEDMLLTERSDIILCGFSGVKNIPNGVCSACIKLDDNFEPISAYSLPGVTPLMNRIKRVPTGSNTEASYIGLSVNSAPSHIVAFNEDLSVKKAVKLSLPYSHPADFLIENDRLIVVAGSRIFVLDADLDLKNVYEYSNADAVPTFSKIITDGGRYFIVGHFYYNKSKKPGMFIFDENFDIIKNGMLASGGEVKDAVITKNGNYAICGGQGGGHEHVAIIDRELTVKKYISFTNRNSVSVYPYSLLPGAGDSLIIAGNFERRAFIGKLSGNWKELHGSFNKFPELYLDTETSITISEVDDIVKSELNMTSSVATVSPAALALTYDHDNRLVVDYGSVQ